MPKFGRWTLSLKPDKTDEWNIEAVIEELLGQLPQELEVWRQAASLGSLRISLGIALSSSNEEFSFSSELIRFLGARNVAVYFDVYHDRECEAQPGSQQDAAR